VGDFGGGFDASSFFSGIVSSIVDAINAIINALNFVWTTLVAAVNFIWNALLAVAKVLVAAVKVIARGFAHVISDIIHGRFLHLFQDYLDLKAKITAWLAPVLRILARIRQLFNQLVLAPMLRFINLIQQLRQFLTVFRLLGFKWAKRLDDSLVRLEQKVVTNTLVLQAWVNLAISVLDLVVDPSLIFRKNFLLASLLSFLGAVKRVVFFGASRTPSTDEIKQAHQDNAALAPQTHLLESGFGAGATYYPTVSSMLPGMDSALAYYQGGAVNA
jgi:hypothetical protein